MQNVRTITAQTVKNFRLQWNKSEVQAKQIWSNSLNFPNHHDREKKCPTTVRRATNSKYDISEESEREQKSRVTNPGLLHHVRMFYSFPFPFSFSSELRHISCWCWIGVCYQIYLAWCLNRRYNEPTTDNDEWYWRRFYLYNLLGRISFIRPKFELNGPCATHTHTFEPHTIISI